MGWLELLHASVEQAAPVAGRGGHVEHVAAVDRLHHLLPAEQQQGKHAPACVRIGMAYFQTQPGGACIA